MTTNITIKAAAQTFAEQLRQSKAIATFWQAKARLETDQAAQALLTRLSERQRALTRKQSAGEEITRSEIDDLRRLQQEVEDDPVIQAYVEALQQAQTYLPMVNREISELLGFDFAGLAQAAGVYRSL